VEGALARLVAQAHALRPPRFTVSVPGDGGAPAIVRRVARIDGLAELDALLSALAAVAPRPLATFDLVAHASSRHDGLLALGDRLVDGTDPGVLAVWARHASTLRARVTAIRLLGCRTAATPRARDTLTRLAAVTGVVVQGTIEPICDAYFDADGLRPIYDNRLADGSWCPPAVGSWA